MEFIVEEIEKILKDYDLKKKKKTNFKIFSLLDSATVPTIVALYKILKKTIIVISENNLEAEFLYKEAFSFIDRKEVCFLPGLDVIPYELVHYPQDLKKDRICTLSRVLSNQNCIIFSSVSGFIKTLPPKIALQDKAILLKKNIQQEPKILAENLIKLGYQREEICETLGQFSVKGSLIDIFSPLYSEPIRIDFFGDLIESIRSFDPLTQKSKREIEEVSILPRDEFILSQEEKSKYLEYIKNSKFHTNTVYEELIPLIRKNVGLLSYFDIKPFLLFPKPDLTQKRLLYLQKEYESLYEKKQAIISTPPSFLISYEKEKQEIEILNGIQFSQLPPSNIEEIKLPIREIKKFKSRIRQAKSVFQEIDFKKNQIFLTASFSAQIERLSSLFEEEKIKKINSSTEIITPHQKPKKNGIFLLTSDLRNGFSIGNLHVYTENDIFGKSYKRKNRFKKQHSQKLQSFIDLKENDFVVHIHHGIGKFVQIERKKIIGKERDFLKLEYANNDILFVPLDQISYVQRYIGSGDKVKLDCLGKASWKKTKEKVQKSVNKIAEELVQIYSARLKLKGFSYPPDTVWQEEFEASFEYEETPDQIEAIESVKKDLESNKPMDRLICGDVGYGKTEIAIRAAFKVSMAGKQTLILVPTTILALQHMKTFQKRFKEFGIQVEMISRLKTSSENKKVLKLFSDNKIDILIGTHAILNPLTKSRNLGMLIIDEEQKFGVVHKEKIKKFRNLIDVLTLSATPIPRTLHMALTGIRELSIINTPPQNRQSIETYVLEEDEEIVVAAITKEIDRGGQIYYLYNRVKTIQEEADYLSNLVPKANIGVLHGQLTEEEIEDTLVDFYEGKYDILVTTTIIESGMDISNVNTLIVKRSDTFGLSQLYQIRGRVGRGDKKAYAYFLYTPNQILTEEAEKRLNTIYEYQELGSGFKVAMRDLEIRGAGNILGEEQSGDIIDVGFELYISMLENAVNKIKGEEIEMETRTMINLDVDFILPDIYIADTKQKIEFYKKFESAKEIDEIDEIALEMEDRFGSYNEKVEYFLLIEKIRVLSSKVGFESIIEYENEIRLKTGTMFKGNLEPLITMVSSRSNIMIDPKNPNLLVYKIKNKNEKNKLSSLINLLQKMQIKKV